MDILTENLTFIVINSQIFFILKQMLQIFTKSL